MIGSPRFGTRSEGPVDDLAMGPLSGTGPVGIEARGRCRADPALRQDFEHLAWHRTAIGVPHLDFRLAVRCPVVAGFPVPAGAADEGWTRKFAHWALRTAIA